MTRKSILITALAVILAAAVLFVVASLQRKADSDRAAQRTAASATNRAQPTNSQKSRETRLGPPREDRIRQHPRAERGGDNHQYMLNAAERRLRALIDAVGDAKPLKPDDPAAASATTTGSAPEAAPELASTITFVLSSRQTVTFELDLPGGLLYREGRAFRPDGDVVALVEAATGVRQ